VSTHDVVALGALYRRDDPFRGALFDRMIALQAVDWKIWASMQSA